MDWRDELADQVDHAPDCVEPDVEVIVAAGPDRAHAFATCRTCGQRATQ